MPHVAPNLVPGSSTKLRKAILAKDDSTIQAMMPSQMAAFLRTIGGLWGYQPTAEHAEGGHAAAPEPEPEPEHLISCIPDARKGM